MMSFPASAYILFIPSIVLTLSLVFSLITGFDFPAKRSRVLREQMRSLLFFSTLFFVSSSIFLIIDTKLYDLADPVFLYILFIVFASYLFGLYFGIGFFLLSLVIVEYYLFDPNYSLPISISSVYSVIGGFVALYTGMFLRDKAEELRLLNVRLTEQISDKEKISSVIVHDIRNSLAVLKLQAQLFRKDPRTLHSGTEVIESEVEKLSSVVESVLSLAKLENRSAQLKKDEFDITLYCRQKLSSYRKIYQYHRFEYSHKGTPIVRANRDTAERILNNLIDNAVKYSKRGTLVRLSTEAKRGMFTIMVSDRGIGIEKHMLETLMLPYAQASQESKGVGLGLHIVKSLTEMQGGNISIESTPGVGTKFIITLPQ